VTRSNAAAPRTKARGLTEDVTFDETHDPQLVRRLARFFRPYTGLLTVTVLSYPAVAIMALVQPYLVKVAIDRHLMPQNMAGFPAIIALTIGALVLEFGFRFAQTLLSQNLGQKVTRDLRLALFRRLQAVDLSYIERNPVGRLMTRVTNDVENLSEAFSTGAVSIVGDLFLLGGIVVMMLLLDVELSLFAFTVLPVLVVFVAFVRVRARVAFRDVRLQLARINSFLNEAIGGMSLVQAFRQEPAMESEFAEVNGRHRAANVEAIKYDALTYAFVEGLSTVAIAAMLLLGASLFSSGAVQVGVFVAFVDYLRRFFQPITELSTKYTVLQSALASAERCVDLLDQPVSIQAPDRAEPVPTLSRGLAFEGVRFRYGDGPEVLRGVDLEIHPAEHVAVVGPTGAGKSTLVKLVSRFYDPTEGRVSFDGKSLTDFDPAELRSRLAVVLQDPYLFEGTIRENIMFGSPDATLKQVERAAELTRAIEVIRRQPGGFDAEVGERGGRLSSGERQLVSFARALVRDPDVLILDEATSSVDPETVRLIQSGLEHLMENRAALIIAHRLSTIESADRIVVMARGQVAEEGTHTQLLERGGLYRTLHELQFP
jgi:ATP-binding cassette, subfamily B, multidrug efflux pump